MHDLRTLPRSLVFSAALSALFQHGLAAPDAALKALRESAAALLNAAPQTSAYCELASARATDACSGADHLEDKLTIKDDGTVSLIRFRSFAENEEPAPGEYRGRYPLDEWRGLLGTIASMDWVKTPPGLPMPGPSETHRKLTLVGGGGKTEYSLAGDGPVGQDRIAAGFDKASLFRPLATDTLWCLHVAVKNVRCKRGKLDLQAFWQVAGKTLVKVTLPAESDTVGCGTVTLRWFEDAPEKPGVTPLSAEIHEAKAEAFKPGTMDFRFPVPAKGASPRKGRLVLLGALVKTPDGAPPVRAAVFSPPFAF